MQGFRIISCVTSRQAEGMCVTQATSGCQLGAKCFVRLSVCLSVTPLMSESSYDQQLQ